METVDSTIFYTIEKTIKTYRRYAQRQFVNNGIHITIDQWLILCVVDDNNAITLKDLAAKVFKDEASLTRITHLLEKNNLISKKQDVDDKRKTQIFLTESGKKTMKSAFNISKQYRKDALNGISKEEVKNMAILLNNIVENCV